MAIPVSSSLTQLNAEIFLQEGFELSLDAIIPSIELTGSFSPFESKTQFFIYNYAKEILYKNLDWESANGSYLSSPPGTSTSTSTSSYNQFQITPVDDVYNKGYSNGNFYAVYNFINYELGSERKIESINVAIPGVQEAGIIYNGHEYFIKDISGDRTELRIQNNFLTQEQIKSNYNAFQNKITSRLNADEFYVSIGNNRNFIGVNTQLELPQEGTSINTTSILIKLYKPLPTEIDLNTLVQIISKVGETQAFEVDFKTDLQFVDNLLSLKGPNYNIDLKDRVNNSTNFKSLEDLINTNSSQSYYQLNSLQDERGVILRKNWADWNQFVKYSSAEERLNNFQFKMTSIENYEAELANLSTITTPSKGTIVFSSSYNAISDNINQIITKFDSYEYFLYYITGSESWPKYGSTYPYPNYSVTSSEALNWFGSTNEQNPYYNTGKNQVYLASRYDNNNQDYLYYLIPPFITDNSNNDQYKNFVNMTGQAFDEMYLYTEAVEQVRNTNSGLTGSVLPLDLADEVITSLGFDTYANSFNSTGFNVNTVGVLPSAGSGLEYITRYIDIASGSVINYYDQQQSTLGYVVALADPSFPYPLDNAAQEIYKRIFHNMVSLVKRKGTVTGLRQLINIWGVPSTMLRISEFGGKNKNDENDYDLWMNRYSNAVTTYTNATSSFVGGTTAFINNIFQNPGSSWDGINPADTYLYSIDWYIVTDQTITAPTVGAYITQRFVQTSDSSLQDQFVGVAGTSVAYWEGASATDAEKATNLAQAMNSSNSTISSLGNAYNVGGIINFQYNAVGAGGNFGQVIAKQNIIPQMYTTSRQGFGGTNGAAIGDTTKPSGSIRIPWQPLTGNYVDGNSPSPDYYSVPDCIQFRFKPQQPTSATANFSQSLLVKGNLYDETADFAITLAYSGSQSGSFSGSILPNDSQYGTLKFTLSGSSTQGGPVSTSPITLPFFDGNWWSVQLQRLINISASNEDTTVGPNYYELKAANNIYDGYDGNQIGFQDTQNFRVFGNTHPSRNEAWNNTHGVTLLSPTNNSFAKGYSAIALGGMMQSPGAPNQFIGSGAYRVAIGDGFLGDFQEFRYYRRALSSSQFNDYVMNPESIQGHADSNTGAGSSYDLLSFRLPLGNELEYTEVSGSATGHDWNNAQGGQVKFLSFGGNSFFAGENAFGSLHPSLVNKQGSLFTSSFILTTNVTTSQYGIAYQGRTSTYTNAITASYLKPNTEINYMDQPAAGIRNRIKNKIQVIDGNEYGTTLSPFRSIQQEFEQSSSYTEDLNSLEVGFSFQNEINDDIIATFGHGVVSDAIADPRFISESSDRYPELTRIAEDYFKKYQGVTANDPTYNGGLPTTIEKEYDYNRLIKFYETSLFKAIKNYVPARTSLSTGIIVKQHLLERNKTDAVVGININTPVAKTPETGSDSWGYTDQTGFNSVMSQQNLLITSSINMYSLTGSAGGSINGYNIITNEGRYYQIENSNLTTPPNVLVNLLRGAPPNTQEENGIFLATDSNGDVYLESEVAFRSQMRFNPIFAQFPASPGVNFTIEMTSSIRGGIFTNIFPLQTSINPPSLLSENYVDVYPDERIYIYLSCDVLDINGNNLLVDSYTFEIGEGNNFTKPEPKSSQQVNWYRDNYTGLLKVKDTQEEFYNGEYSGSNIPVELNEYNPYRIYADGSNLNPDTSESLVAPPTTNLAATPYNTTRFPTVTATAATAVPIRATGSLLQYSGSYNSTTGASGDALLIQDVTPPLNAAYQWVKITSEDGITRTYSAIGSSNSRFDISTYPAQENQFILSEETDIFRTQTDGGIFSGTVSTAGTGTFNLTDQYGKQIEMDMQWSGNTIIFATVTNNNLGNDNGSLWPKADSAFLEDDAISFSGHTLTFTLSSAASLNNLPAFGLPNLLMVQFIYSGANFLIAGNLKNAIESSNGHNGSLLVTQHNNQGASNRISLQLFNTTVGNTYANAIQFSTLGTNEFADNVGGICVLDEGGADGDYYFPTTIQQGVDQPSISTIYLQNSITNLTPGITYDISFDITNYATDGFGNSNFDVGLSSNDAPGGTANGIDNTARATSNAAISHSWVQAAGTSVAQFFSATGTYANISNVSVAIPPAVLAPKHFYERDSFTIMPTGSQLFQNSPYNPLLHNVSGSRKNSFLLDMDYDPVLPSTPFIQGLPSDYQFLTSASQLGWEGVATNDNLLEFSDIPDSNYTTTAIINPRYNGSKITSADYNFYTGIPSESKMPAGITGLANPPYLLTQNKIQYINGETGSWTGDTSYGKTAVIDRNPINIAHFKSSLESKEYYGTTTFNINQLIQIPFEEILSEQSPIITSSLINGSNQNLVPISSTFMPGREATIIYNQTSKTFNNVGGTILNYANLGIGSSVINAGGINFEAYQSNERALDILTTTQFYDLPIWYNYAAALISFNNPSFSANPAIQITPNSSSIKLTSSLYPSIASPFDTMNQELPMENNLSRFATGSSSNVSSENSYYTNAPNVVMGVTGSLKDADNRDVGIINIKGPNIGKLTGFFAGLGSSVRSLLNVAGPSLMLFNSINNMIKLGDLAAESSSTVQLPVPAGGPYNGFNIPVPLFSSTLDIVNPRDTNLNQYNTTWGIGSIPILDENNRRNRNNYFRWNISSSQLSEYRDMKEKIIIEKGDEIRVSYAYEANDGITSILSKTHQDFTVLGYHQLPPSLFTNTILDTSLHWPELRFEIASYKQLKPEPLQAPVSPGKNSRNTFLGPLPKDGYYSFSSLLDKYKAAKNNSDRIALSMAYGEGQNPIELISLSGSITGVSSHTVIDGTGIIGITASMDSSYSVDNDNAAWNMSFNYVSNISSSIPIYETGISTAVYDNNLMTSASVNPIINYGAYAQLLDPGYFFDRVIVTPNPTELLNGIPTGRIYGMTLRKRVEADDRVVLDVNQPSGSAGALTLSGDGYLIPNDLTNIQQGNVQKIINKLKSENVFQPDSNDLQS